MNKETLIFCLFGFVFVITVIVVMDIFQINGIAAAGGAGIIAGPFAFWWAFKFLATRSQKQQIILTLIYGSALLLVVSLQKKIFPEEPKTSNQSCEFLSGEYRPEIMGKWKAIQPEGDSSEFALSFVDETTVITSVNDDDMKDRYRYVSDNHIEFLDYQGNVNNRFSYKVANDTLTLSNAQETMQLVKTPRSER